MHTFAPCRSASSRRTLDPITMSTLLLTDQNNPSCVISERSRARTRLSTYVRSRALDRGSRNGRRRLFRMRAPPLTARPHADRCHDSGWPGTYDQEADQRCSPPAASAHFPCAVLSTQDHPLRTLERLAERLVSDEPVDARGIAQVRLLLIGDRGALYDHPGADDLDPALREAIQALELLV